MDTALRRISELSTEIDPLRTQLENFNRHQRGCQVLQARHYGIGWLCAAIIWAEIGDARRFHSSDQPVRFASMDVTVYSSDAKRSPGHLSRQGSPELRWAVFEAAKSAARRGSPDYAYHHLATAPHSGKNPTLAVERKLLRRCYHTLRDLGDAALSAPGPTRKAARDDQRARALPTNQPMPAASSRNAPATSPVRVDLPERNNQQDPHLDGRPQHR